VYTVWLPMLGPDSRSQVDMSLVGDPRVRHYWDGDRTAGRWFAEAGVGEPAYAGIVWDAYYLFGPDAVWNERPAPLEASGSPVISHTGALENAVAKLLR
jgi:hypothetical protein